jgi:hypothetical protein
MKRIRSLLVKGFSLGLIALILVSCDANKDDKLTDQQIIEITKEIESVVNNFFDPKTLNAATHSALRANNAGYIFAGDGKVIFTDYDSYKEGVELSFENIQRFIELENTKTYVYVLAKDAVTCTTEFQGNYINTSNDTITHNGCWTFVFKKFDNEWKVIHENGTHTTE